MTYNEWVMYSFDKKGKPKLPVKVKANMNRWTKSGGENR